MGIYVDYNLFAEGDEHEVRDRMENIRRRCMDLPLKSVGEVIRMEPVYCSMTVSILTKQGHALPEVMAERIRPYEEDRVAGQLTVVFATMIPHELPEPQSSRYYAPALEWIKRTDLLKSEDLPERVEEMTPWGKPSHIIYRHGIEMEYANIMLRHGFVLIVHPGEGSETLNLAVSTFGSPGGEGSGESPLWSGRGFTKTQYATNFVQAHENVCQVMDIVKEEGLLREASDNSGYYESRSWKEAGKRVNEELVFARVASSLFDVAVGDLREEGTNVKVLEDNASKARPVDFSAALAREQEASESPEDETAPE